ncbi:acyl-CoA dehydrogenase family protein [Ancylobacter polymorphus]|uniref:Acyl-CoA/acyl-ACP dehydrogenase n=1 Tax=Ancylobacter polymorphus TaxID=223390 RepID=A0A9E7D8A1_9HYPH|nr:acyl-CoA dehydrogenase family protein [Ancylobacter polymorphus]UOK73326.1 acyl-CoA/acyl-ACP dehydrogenase [Ancylobacter polymorphus]
MNSTEFLEALAAAADAATTFAATAREASLERLTSNAAFDAKLAHRHQRILHGLAWISTTANAISSASEWAQQLAAQDALSAGEELTLRIGVAEYLAQLVGGIPMSQSEIFRPAELGLDEAAERVRRDDRLAALTDADALLEVRVALIDHLRRDGSVSESVGDKTLDMVRDQFRRFGAERIRPYAHQWHLADELIPDEVVGQLAELGTFGVCIPEEYGGLGLGKLAMSIISEELSRCWIAAGSLGTRSEIAGELILLGGTDEQKDSWLPRLASGEVLPTAVFTEPDHGSDLGGLRTRATRRTDGGWEIDGNKTWITHAARSDLMTVLARTAPDSRGYEGLSVFLAPKPRGSDADPFPANGMSGGEIAVLGYRGMKEYEISFSGFEVASSGLLGGETGNGFKQLMQTFEGARVQTAARAVGVAFNAYDLAWQYALDRHQFGRPLIDFPRVSDKIALMFAEAVLARTFTYAAARAKDEGRRCDIEAGMAKLLAARVAWSSADNALQIHGGNGYALEFEISRVLCDARILNIFEGAAEIQAQVVGRGILSRSRN